MFQELSKREKKIAKACIDKGLEAEFKEGLEKCQTIMQDWQAGNFATNKEAYHQLFKAVHEKDNAIARRYDGLTGSRWLITVVELFKESYISDDDIKDFSDETKAFIKMRMSRL